MKVYEKTVTVIETKDGQIEVYREARLIQNFINLMAEGVERTRPALNLSELSDIVECVIEPLEAEHAMWIAKEILAEGMRRIK